MALLRKILKWIGLGVLALAIVGAIYQQVGLWLDDRLGPPPGDMVAVNGRAVHLVCQGSG